MIKHNNTQKKIMICPKVSWKYSDASAENSYPTRTPIIILKAFPKNNTGRDVMIDTPSVIEENLMKELSIMIKKW